MKLSPEGTERPCQGEQETHIDLINRPRWPRALLTPPTPATPSLPIARQSRLPKALLIRLTSKRRPSILSPLSSFSLPFTSLATEALGGAYALQGAPGKTQPPKEVRAGRHNQGTARCDCIIGCSTTAKTESH